MTHRFYTLWSPVYDFCAGPLFVDLRKRAIAELDLKPGDKLLIPGVGSGLDFEYLPRGLEVVGEDLNATMLGKARGRAKKLGFDVHLALGDAEKISHPDASFDAVYLPCICCVAEDGSNVLREALRVVKRGGRVVVVDKFLGEGRKPGIFRTLADAVLGPLVSRVNRRWSDVSGGVSGFTILSEAAGPLGGFFRLFVLRKD